MPISLSALGVNLDRLYLDQPAVAGETVYTAPGATGGGARTQVTSIRIANPTNSSVAVQLLQVKQGQTANGSQSLVGGLVIPANSTYESDVPTTLRPGDTLWGQSDSIPMAPQMSSVASSTGGTLAAGSYFYRYAATNAKGESPACLEIGPVAVTGSTSSVALSWPKVGGATGYKVYRGTSSGNLSLLAAVTGQSTLSYTDTGTATTSGGPAGAGTAPACTFTLCGAELPA
ncbi:hypothetical protein [Kineosporia succinea]|uniref:Uncharacterized protein n=1 Tax=Kineosporia succinea TaxID=84632 RepID=A0ABT9P9R4_9ACTN|nr:hypothetical protein [Kineosporia succinea]MDP9829434.1 hypothetical protein [Kineosporia succinea]